MWLQSVSPVHKADIRAYRTGVQKQPVIHKPDIHPPLCGARCYLECFPGIKRDSMIFREVVKSPSRKDRQLHGSADRFGCGRSDGSVASGDQDPAGAPLDLGFHGVRKCGGNQ